MLITSTLHPESDTPRDYEIELIGRPIPHKGWLPFISAYGAAVRFQPDVVVTEYLRDPRWRAFARLAPRVRFRHDVEPHDPTQIPPWWNRMFFERWDKTAYATVVFSNHVAQRIRNEEGPQESLYVAPLTSDLDPSLIPDFVPAHRRKDFLLIGRQHPYKNHKVVFSAWEAHTRRPAWMGDELVVLGAGEVPFPLPPHARWENGPYRYGEMVSKLAASKGSVVHTRAASQSGVHVLSMQLGVPTLVSTAGALSEYQPPGLSVTGIDDADSLAEAFDTLADPTEVAIQGKKSMDHYYAHYNAKVAAERLLQIFEEIVKRSEGRRVDE